MNSRNKLYATAGFLLLLAVGILLWQSAQRPATALVDPVERARSIRRESTSPPRPHTPRTAKDSHTLQELMASNQKRKLTQQEIDSFVEAQHRSMDSLLSAFRLSGDEAYLKEALANFPNHPQVLLQALNLASDPGKRLELLEALKRADPGNGIGNCLAAKALFELGKNDEAFTELLQSRGKPIQDFWITSTQSDEENYLSAGYPPVQAKMISVFGSSKTELAQISGINKKLEELRTKYASAGDGDAVQSVRDIQSEIGSQLQEDPSLIGELVGIAVEKGALKGLDDPESIARLEEIEKQKKSLVEGSKKVQELMGNATVPESDWLLYFDRVKLFGEKAANDWMLGKYPDR